MMRILLVDDHPVVRHGLRTILAVRLKGEVVGEAGEADSGLSQ
jgi:DNA-binding NarL/FixJ family response regulator